MGIEEFRRDMKKIFGTKEPTTLNNKLDEYARKFGEYPPSEPDYPFEDDKMIEVLDICIKENITFEDLTEYEYEEGCVY